MGFQGDVAGLGLGELLQGLARGGREGVLTLRGGGLGARVGVEGGQIFLLPEVDEDPDVWRKRSERAWAGEPDQRIDMLRMSEIAYAARMEAMFLLLDCEGVHFRFEPGPLPDPKVPERAVKRAVEPDLARMETGGPIDAAMPVHCRPISVEFMLLEYARLQDEVQSYPAALTLSEHAVPCTLLAEAPTKGLERFWRECDATSNVTEIADRLAWPVRQCRLTVQQVGEAGNLRLADAREMLALCSNELAANHFTRAASRLSGWCETAVPGPPAPDEAQLLLGDWERGKLPVVLANMQPRTARDFLRRLDLAAGNVVSSVARWQEMRRFHKHDALAEVRLLHWQCRSDNEADAPAMNDLLRVARKFQEVGQNLRAGAMLRAAAARGPETTAVRLELGQRLIAIGAPADGVPWVLEACRTLIEAGSPDKAVAPLRAVLDSQPTNREVRALLGSARTKSTSGKRTRRNSAVVLAGVLALVLIAFVKVRMDQTYDRRFEDIADGARDPEATLAALDAQFPGDNSTRVRELREKVQLLLHEKAKEQREAWSEQYEQCRLECALGDPLLGLKSALALPPPPEQPADTPAGWPTLTNLLNALAGRLEQTLAEWGEPTDAQQEQLYAEQRLATLNGSLLALLDGHEEALFTDFRTRTGHIAAVLRERDEARAKQREKLLRTAQIEQQDLLLKAAHAHRDAGDLERAVQTYHQLMEIPGSEKLIEILKPEIAKVEAHLRAVLEARELARKGDHKRALETLATVCKNPSEHLLPCQIDSQPQGARVRLGDGSTRVTPFEFEVAPGEKLMLQFELAGHEPESVVLEDPADRSVVMSRTPERWWRTNSSVEALPVSVEDDHVLVDRGGHLARLSKRSDVVWQSAINSLGGIARTPVFLPKRAGSLLLVTEDGGCWLVDAGDGRLEGPWGASSPPISGPSPSGSGVVVGFQDGARGQWESRLKPDITPAVDPSAAAANGHRDNGHDAGLAVLRRSAAQTPQLDSPWGDWTVEVGDTHFLVRRRGQPAVVFCARRDGEWNYIAWEAPHSKLRNGRLWVSDHAGLRGFEP
jgi:tetratricopeptide (TPR) repeat protein